MAGKNIFDSVKMTRQQSNRFDLTHDVKLSMNMGELVPVMCTECVPGDNFEIGCESLIRFAPLIAPMMHRCDVTVHYFFVPNRLVWEAWEDYITNTETAGSLPAFPTIAYDNGAFPQYTALCDYMGLPLPFAGMSVETVSAIPFAAYQMIYNEYYRDQNLQAEVEFELNNGAQGSAHINTHLWPLRKRAWEHDYFTAALPFAQKGDAVELPLGSVELDGTWFASGSRPTFRRDTGTSISGDLQQLTGITAGQADVVIDTEPANSRAYDPDGSLTVGATTINDLRRAFRLQEWLEKAARGGSRYIENILIHFGIRSSDKRLQRPEYITGVKSPITISEVLNTSGTLTEPQGNMAGHGVGTVSGKYGNYFCEEHGYIIGIMSVMPKTAYQQGIPKHFLKINDPFEFFWPSFANLGEQEVQNRELYAGTLTGGETFGYVPRYSEYKFENNRVAGEFRTTLNYWHMGRIFASQPALNSTFVQCDPTHRVFAVTDPLEDKLFCQVLNKVSVRRLMPKYGTPTF